MVSLLVSVFTRGPHSPLAPEGSKRTLCAARLMARIITSEAETSSRDSAQTDLNQRPGRRGNLDRSSGARLYVFNDPSYLPLERAGADDLAVRL